MILLAIIQPLHAFILVLKPLNFCISTCYRCRFFDFCSRSVSSCISSITCTFSSIESSYIRLKAVNSRVIHELGFSSLCIILRHLTCQKTKSFVLTSTIICYGYQWMAFTRQSGHIGARFEAPVRAQTITTYDVGENHLYSSNSALNPSISFLTSKLFTFGHFCNLVNVSVEGVLRRLASSHFLS